MEKMNRKQNNFMTVPQPLIKKKRISCTCRHRGNGRKVGGNAIDFHITQEGCSWSLSKMRKPKYYIIYQYKGKRDILYILCYVYYIIYYIKYQRLEREKADHMMTVEIVVKYKINKSIRTDIKHTNKSMW